MSVHENVAMGVSGTRSKRTPGEVQRDEVVEAYRRHFCMICERVAGWV
jgi:hypothetical protein